MSTGETLSHTVYRASSLIARGLDCSEAEGFVRLKGRAAEIDAPIDDVARLVLDGTITFTTGGTGPRTREETSR